MIGSLAGTLTSATPPHLMLEVGGVGYEIEAPMSTFTILPHLGERTRLWTHLHVREDAHILYGFGTVAERSLFRNLLKVSGVGPRIALAILSGVSAASFAQVVRSEDTAMLTRIPGVGRKTAERLIIEMRDRIDSDVGAIPVGAAVQVPATGPESEAYTALVAFFGYKPAEATRLLKSVGGGDDALTTEELIRRALQGAARS